MEIKWEQLPDATTVDREEDVFLGNFFAKDSHHNITICGSLIFDIEHQYWYACALDEEELPVTHYINKPAKDVYNFLLEDKEVREAILQGIEDEMENEDNRDEVLEILDNKNLTIATEQILEAYKDEKNGIVPDVIWGTIFNYLQKI